MIAWMISSYIVANTRLNFPICVAWKIGEIKLIIYVIKPINNCIFIAYFLKLWFLKPTFHIDFFFNPRNTNPVPSSIHPGKRHIAINTILPDILNKIYNYNHQDIMNVYEEIWIFESHTYLNVIHIEVLSFALLYVNWKMYDEMVEFFISLCLMYSLPNDTVQVETTRFTTIVILVVATSVFSSSSSPSKRRHMLL